MKIGDEFYASINSEGEIREEHADKSYADNWSDYYERNGINLKVVPVTLLPTSEVERLRKCAAALKPFARGHEYADEELSHVPDRDSKPLNPYDRRSPTFGDCRTASAALARPANGENTNNEKE